MAGVLAALASAMTEALAAPESSTPAPADAKANAATVAPIADPKRPFGDGRLYAGITAATLEFYDEQNGISFNDSSTGFGLYAGFLLREQLAVELSYDSFDAIDLHDLAGSGTARFDVTTQRRTVAFSAVRTISLRELFSWPRDWRLFGTIGVYDSRLARTITPLGSGTPASVDDESTGLALGAGVLYRIGPVDVRGYVRTLGAIDNREALEAGAAVQLRF